MNTLMNIAAFKHVLDLKAGDEETVFPGTRLVPVKKKQDLIIMRMFYH